MAMRIEANLYKMVNVLSIEDLTETQRVVRDLALIKVLIPPARRSEVLDLVQIFRARAVDVSPETMTVEITGDQGKIEGMVAALRPFGIVEMVQSGTVAMSRGSQGDAARAAHGAGATQPACPCPGSVISAVYRHARGLSPRPALARPACAGGVHAPHRRTGQRGGVRKLCGV